MPQQPAITLVIAEDHLMIRSALVTLIDSEPDMSVVGECGRGDEAVALVGSVLPDVAVLDADMPGLDGLATCKVITERFPATKCMVLTALNKPGLLQRALRAGARGFIVKYAPTEELLNAVRSVAAGGRAVDASLAVAALTSRDLMLTERELQVVQLLADGASDREIGRQLNLSSGTVRNYLSNVMTRVDARNRVDLIRIGLRDGWLFPGR